MMTFRNQIVASTAIDSDGEQLPLSRLTQLFDQLPDPNYMGEAHDFSCPTTARMYNKRIEEQPDGTHAIVVDIDTIDDTVFERNGGYSLSYTVAHYVANPSLDIDIEVLVNQKHYPIEEFTGALFDDSAGTPNVAVLDFKQKAAVPGAVLVLKLVGGAILTGIIWDTIKWVIGRVSHLMSTHDSSNDRTSSIQIPLRMRIDTRTMDAVIVVDTNKADILQDSDVPIESARRFIRRYARGCQISKIAIGMGDAPDDWQLLYIVDDEGHTISL